MSGSKPRGRLSLRLLKAIGKSDDKALWDDSFQQGFVKAELRAPSKNVKVQSSMKKVAEGFIDWDEELTLDMPSDATELRLMLCKEKRYATRTGAAVVAACGLFVDPLLAAVPIDKQFDMYKPSGAGAGGQIHIIADYHAFQDDKDWETHPGHLPALAEESGDGKRPEANSDRDGAALPHNPEATSEPRGEGSSSASKAAASPAGGQDPALGKAANAGSAEGPSAPAAGQQAGSAGLEADSAAASGQRPAEARSSAQKPPAASAPPRRPAPRPGRGNRKTLLAAIAIAAGAVVAAQLLRKQ